MNRRAPAAGLPGALKVEEPSGSQDRCAHPRPGGAIAQLGERLNGIQEVGGSIPPGSTKFLIPSDPEKCRVGARALEQVRRRWLARGSESLFLIRFVTRFRGPTGSALAELARAAPHGTQLPWCHGLRLDAGRGPIWVAAPLGSWPALTMAALGSRARMWRANACGFLLSESCPPYLNVRPQRRGCQVRFPMAFTRLPWGP